MPAYHSKLEDDDIAQQACSCGIIALKTNIRGPADAASPDEEDIIDETLNFFRANVFFRNFDVKGKADRTLIYLTLYTHYLLVKCEKINDRAAAAKEFHNLAIKQFVVPGEAGWPLGTLFPAPENRTETDLFKAYFKQARDELGNRLLDRLFDADGSKNKWWQSFSKRKFMGKEFRD